MADLKDQKLDKYDPSEIEQVGISIGKIMAFL